MNTMQKNEQAVSEIMGILLILFTAIIAFSGLYMSVLSDEGPMEETFVRIKGFVEGPNIVMEHQGGESIPEESYISFQLPGETIEGPISNFLIDTNDDGTWNIGERLTQNFTYNLSRLDEYTVANVTATDKTSNALEFMGPVEFNPVSDAGLDIIVTDMTAPYDIIKIDDHIQITIMVTSYGGDVGGSGGVQVSYMIPEGLIYQNSNSPSGHGSYDNNTGIWNVGNVFVGEPATIQINAIVQGIEQREFVQLAMVLDGSGSIEWYDWDDVTLGLSNSVRNEDIFPHDGSVELTVIQFGTYPNNHCTVEIPPTIVTSSNYDSIANTISVMGQGNGGTPMAAGTYLAADTLRSSPNFAISNKQVITLVTDGKPTYYTYSDAYNRYIGDGDGWDTDEEDLQTTETAKNYSIDHLLMNDGSDEFNSLAVGSGPDVPWLNGSIVWPEPGIIWDIANSESPSGPGWVATIDSFEEFESATAQIFKVIFSGIKNTASFHSSVTFDPNDTNNEVEITITPE